jgi:hypothetical protein
VEGKGGKATRGCEGERAGRELAHFENVGSDPALSQGASKVQDGTRRPTERTSSRGREGDRMPPAERGREGRAQASTGREAFSRSITYQTTSREREPARRAAGRIKRSRRGWSGEGRAVGDEGGLTLYNDLTQIVRSLMTMAVKKQRDGTIRKRERRRAAGGSSASSLLVPLPPPPST